MRGNHSPSAVERLKARAEARTNQAQRLEAAKKDVATLQESVRCDDWVDQTLQWFHSTVEKILVEHLGEDDDDDATKLNGGDLSRLIVGLEQAFFFAQPKKEVTDAPASP